MKENSPLALTRINRNKLASSALKLNQDFRQYYNIEHDAINKLMVAIDKDGIRSMSIYALIDKAISSPEQIYTTLENNGVFLSLRQQYPVLIIKAAGELEQSTKSKKGLTRYHYWLFIRYWRYHYALTFSL